MIYFAQDSGSLNIKIGFTKGNANARVSSLQTGCPTPLVLLATCDGSTFGESELHEKFKDAWVNGEWFRPVPQLLQFIYGLGNLNDSERCFFECDMRTKGGRDVRGCLWAHFDDISDDLLLRMLLNRRDTIRTNIEDLRIEVEWLNERRQRTGQPLIEMDLNFTGEQQTVAGLDFTDNEQVESAP